MSVKVDGEQLPFFGVIGVFREPSTPTPHYHHPTTLNLIIYLALAVLILHVILIIFIEVLNLL